jgi:hypothetical protein
VLAEGARTTLSVVLRGDFDDARRDGLMVSSQEVRFVDVSAGAHSSQTAPTEEWAKLARNLCDAAPEIVCGRLREMDDIAAQHPDAAAACAWWPLAVAVLTGPYDEQTWSDATPVILRATPRQSGLSGPLGDAVRALVHDAVGRGIWAVSDLLQGQQQRVDANPQLLALLRRGYLEQALADPEWLCAETPPPQPGPGGEDVYDVAAPAAANLREARDRMPHWSIAALRFVYLLTAYGVDDFDRTRRLRDDLLLEAVDALPVTGLSVERNIGQPDLWSAGVKM